MIETRHPFVSTTIRFIYAHAHAQPPFIVTPPPLYLFRYQLPAHAAATPFTLIVSLFRFTNFQTLIIPFRFRLYQCFAPCHVTFVFLSLVTITITGSVLFMRLQNHLSSYSCGLLRVTRSPVQAIHLPPTSYISYIIPITRTYSSA